MRGCKHRVEIQLGDLGEVRHQARDILDQRRERLAIDGLRAAHAFEDLGGGDAVEHRERIFAARGREAEGDVFEHFDQHAAEAERDQLAE